jgi:endoglucanase Acf2
MRKLGRYTPILIILMLFSYSWPQTMVGQGSYATTGGTGVPGFTPYLTSDFTQKSISNTWWVTLATTQYSQNLFAHPASYRATANGLEMGYPGLASLGGTEIASSHVKSLTIGITGLNADAAQVAAYSHFSVTARWTSGATVMEATMCHGIPFVYCKITGGPATITFNGTPSLWYNQGGVVGATIGGKYFGIFAPTGSSWSGTTTLSSTLSGKDYLSVALLPDATQSTLLLFKQYAYTFVKEARVDYAYNEAIGRLNSVFRIVPDIKEGSEPGTIFALLRHQWQNSAATFLPFTYQCARGEMKVTAGPSFTTNMTFNGILPAFPDTGIDHTTLSTLLNDIGATCGGGDTYGAGKSMGKVAAGAQMANLVGNTTKRDQLVQGLKTALQGWLLAGGNQQFYYHKPWNRLIGYPASYGSDGRFADHHFHYGYFMQAAAVIAQFDPTWAKQENWGGMVNMLARDVNTWDDNDSLFGRFSCFDPYEGHGWADGMGFDRGNNQESSSESMNFNAGLIMWGVNTGNKVIRDLGIFMYVNEARAIAQYWWDVDNAVFPAAFTHTCVGMVWTNGGAYSTWFSGNPSNIHGINFLPITPGHLYLGRCPEYNPKNYQEGSTGGWPDLFNEFLAFSDPVTALQKYNAGLSIEGGNSKALCYHEINSLNAVGKLDTQVTASTPTFATFDKGNIRTYCVYNPDSTDKTVTFNDGFSMTVSGKKQLCRTGPMKPISVIVPVANSRPAALAQGKMIALNGVLRLTGPMVQGKIALYDCSGKKVWEASNVNVSQGGTIRLPACVKRGVYVLKTR